MASTNARRLWFNSFAQGNRDAKPRPRFVPQLQNLEDRLAPATLISIADSSAAEQAGTGTSNMDFTVTRSGFLNSQITVGYTTVAGTAQANVDFTPQTGTVTFTPGSTTQHILIPIHGNNVFDTPDLTFTVQLTGITDVVGTPISFSGSTQFAVAEEANYAAVGDINADGKPDMVVSNENFGPSNGTTVSVLLNTTPNGAAAPTFASRVDFTVGTHPTVVAIADFNQDGKLDVAVANNDSANVSLLRNTTATGAGTPTFAAQQTLAAPASLVHLTVGDFNNDNKPDLIASDRNANSVTVWINTTPTGNSTFTFAAPGAFATGTKARWAAVGDLNNDGKQDVVVANFTASTLTVLRNTTTVGGNTPSFDIQGPFSIGTNPRSVTLGDINGDGKRDVLVATEATNTVSVRLNTTTNGSATISLAATVTVSTGDLPRSVAAVDFNNDGRPDVAAGNYNDNTISVFRNDTIAGAATPAFVGQGTLAANSKPNSIEAADFNGDGKLDMVAANHGTANATVLLNTSDVPAISDGVATGTIIEFGSPPLVQFSVAAETADETAGTVNLTVTLSAASGSDVSVPFTVGGTATAGVDFNSVTASPLLIPAGQTSGTISLTILNDGSADIADETVIFTLGPPTGGNLGPITTNTLTIIEPQALGLYTTGADAGGGPHVQVFNPDGTIRTGFFAYGAGFTGGVRVATGDVDGDRIEDIITAAGAGGGPHVKVFSGADGHLVASFFAFSPSFAGGVYVAAGDVNLDKKAEIIVAPGAGGGPHVKVIDATKLGQIQANSQIADSALLQSFFAYGASFTGGVRVAAGDIDLDGRADVVTGPGATGGPHVRVFSAGNPAVVLRNFMAFDTTFAGGVFVAAGDLDGDFRAEVVVSQGQGLGAHVRTFSGATGAQTNDFVPFANTQFSGSSGVRVAVEDRDGDRKKDIVVGAGPNIASKVRIFKGTTLALLDEFAPYDPNFQGGVFVG